MTRALGATNIAHIDSGHTHPVLMAKLLFSTPIYTHSGLGIIVFDTNNYLGVGILGGVAGLDETETVVPTSVKLSLNGLDSDLLAESMNASNFGDRVTLYFGYRNDDGTLIADPWIFWKGRVESSDLVAGTENIITVTIQHDLAILKKNIGTRYTDEEQQRRFAGDTAFRFVSQMQIVQLNWGRRDRSVRQDALDSARPSRGGSRFHTP